MMRPVAVALISAAALRIVLLVFFEGRVAKAQNLNFIILGLFAVSLFVLRKFKLNPIWVMLGSGIIGGVIFSLI